MNILIIGNGFDIAHNLKTTYKDFLGYWEKMRPRAYLENWPGAPPHWKKEHINVWFNYFLEKQNTLGDTWIDFETEIYNVITKIRERGLFPQHSFLSKMNINFLEAIHNNEAHYLTKLEQTMLGYYENCTSPERIEEYAEYKYCNNPTMYIFKTYKGLINFLYDQLREFTKTFEVYLTKELGLAENIDDLGQRLRYRLPKDTKWDVISFNYTSTFSQLYPHAVNNPIVYVHGQATNNKGCALVLGTKSFDRNSTDKNLPFDFNVFQKHNQRHKYGTIEAYQDLLKRIKNSEDITLGVIGHSLDETDHNILKHIFTANENTQINIYYHDNKAQEKLIKNITEIIGEAEVMAKVRLIDQHEEKRGLLRKSQQ
ncbi:hypothetical protein NO2_0540 [Candidatus Termititenax persephonae]|uniref:Bacteriophage abortive infection AbiH n=1 Tax=Candidatus Termititenax persephonae TaxID=2218525 RepID=A0A388TFR5_9BACT|nr:hypothetical protein NO2_0540 [Candidatus Termititenax persephonae]